MNKIPFLLVAVALSGCASSQNSAAIDARANRPVVCKDETDCKVKWSRALQWVKEHSTYKFDIVSDNALTTKGPIDGDPSSAFSITKILQADGSASFDFSGGCGNMFACIPSVRESKASFVDYVMGPASPIPSAPFTQTGKAQLGVKIIELPPKVGEALNKPDLTGVVVVAASPGSPAEKAGLRMGDIITFVDETQILGVQSLQDAIASRKVDQTVKIKIYRGPEQLTLNAPLN